MENVKLNQESLEDAKLWDADDEDVTARLEQIAMEAKVLGKVNEAEDLIASVLALAKLTHVKTGKFMTDNRNMIGGSLGVMLGVGLELLSPTGSKTSAIISGVVGGATLALLSPVLKAAPQTTGIQAGTGVLTSFVSMSAGRIAADYFPGNLKDND